MSSEHEHNHHEGCCSHHHHTEDFLKAELSKQIDEILKKREKAAFHTHTDDCRHCGEDAE